MKAITAGTTKMAKMVKGKLLNGSQIYWQLRDLVPVHEIRNAGRGLDGGGDRVGCFQLEKHRHAVTAEAEEHALAETEDAAAAPEQDQADGDEAVAQVFADQIQPEDRQGQREDDQQKQEESAEGDRFAACFEEGPEE